MWRIALAFIAFSVVALYLIMVAGDQINMPGEAGHGVPSSSAPIDATSPPTASSPQAAPALAASK